MCRLFNRPSGQNPAPCRLDTSTGEPVQFVSREYDAQAATGRLPVPCDSLENTLVRLGIERCDLLKIDAEGAEYAILFNASDQALEKLSAL